MTVEVGYYASWAANRACKSVRPSQINGNLYSHIIYSFAIVTDDFKLAVSSDNDIPLMKELVKLKESKPSLKVMIAVGGWAFNDPPTQSRFTNMAATPASRQAFINSAVDFMGQYDFDGIDIDWEYPGADDRGGRPEDYNNFVSLLSEMHSAFQGTAKRYLITIAAPLSNWYLRHFDLSRIKDFLDFFNVMSYDIHGVWDSNIPSLGPYVQSHTNITEIEQGLNMFFKSGVPPHKLALGMGAYGRTFTLADSGCTSPGCVFSGPGNAGQCT